MLSLVGTPYERPHAPPCRPLPSVCTVSRISLCRWSALPTNVRTFPPCRPLPTVCTVSRISLCRWSSLPTIVCTHLLVGLSRRSSRLPVILSGAEQSVAESKNLNPFRVCVSRFGIRFFDYACGYAQNDKTKDCVPKWNAVFCYQRLIIITCHCVIQC